MLLIKKKEEEQKIPYKTIPKPLAKKRSEIGLEIWLLHYF